MMALALASITAFAKTDVTNYLTDAELNDESKNWNLVSGAGNHTGSQNGYHESWHNTFTLTQQVDVPAGYYQVSVQVAVDGGNSTTFTLLATSGTNKSTAAVPKYSTWGSYADMATWWSADATHTGNANLNRIYTTVKVDDGQTLTIKLEQTSNAQWVVYGQMKLFHLTDKEGQAAMEFEKKYNGLTGQDLATGRYKQRFENYDETIQTSGDRLKKTISGLPNGKYSVTIGGAVSVTGDRFSGTPVTGDGHVVFFANNKSVNVPVADRTAVADDAFEDYTVNDAIVTDGTLTFGYRIIDASANWFVGSIKSIDYLGVDLSDYEVPYNEARAEAQTAILKPLNATVKAEVETTLGKYGEFDTFTSMDEVNEALTDINNATAKANASIADYEKIKVYVDKAADLNNQAAKDHCNSFIEKYNDRTATADDIDNAAATYRQAVLKQDMVADMDLSEAIVNNDFTGCENFNFPGWTIVNPNNGNAWKNGDTRVEYWKENPADGKFDYYQTITGLRKGTYRLKAGMWNSMNGVEGTFSAAAGVYGTSAGTTGWGLVTEDIDNPKEFTSEDIVVTNGELRIGVANKETMAARWFGVDYINLYYVGPIDNSALITNIETLLTEADELKAKHQTASIKQALTAAVAAAQGYDTIDDTDQLQAIVDQLGPAVSNSKVSVDAYEELYDAIFSPNYNDFSTAIPALTFTYRDEAEAMYDAAEVASDVAQQKAAGMFMEYRTYVKNSAQTIGSKVLAVKEVRSDAWEFTTEPENKGNFINQANYDIAANVMRENWKGGGLAVGDMKQTLTNLPNGKYMFKMASFTRKSPNIDDYIYIKSGANIAMAVSLGDAANGNGYVNMTEPIEVTNGEIEIGLHIGSGADWAAIGDAELYVLDVNDYQRTTPIGSFGTICLPYEAQITAGIIYESSLEGDVVKLTEKPDGILQPGQAYIYYHDEESGYPTFKYQKSDIIETPAEGTLLQGVFQNTAVPVGDYVLQTKAGVQKFYIVATDNQPTLSQYKAYLKATPVSAGAKALGFSFEGTGCILNKAVEALTNGKTQIFGADGKARQKLQQGINIVNGIKVFVTK